MEEKATSSPSNHSGHTELFSFDMEIKRQIDRVSQLRHFLVAQCKIYRVHGHLRNINEKAYEPEVIAIGPYHHGKDNLKMMEDHKWRYFITLIDGRNENSDKYYSAVKPLEQVARNCYADPISLKETEFIKMLILDGCFIIELARKINKNEDDPIARMGWMISILRRDLMLFENQIPFFVLCELFDLTEGPNQRSRLIGLLTRVFLNVFPGKVYRESSIGLLTRFFRNIYHDDKEDSNRNPDEDIESSNRRPDEDIESSNRRPEEIKHLLHLIRINLVSSFESDLAERANYKRKQLRDIKSASWLTEANVKFKRNEGARNSFDIKFENGTVLLPPLRISDGTESFWRNIIAYEQYSSGTQSCYLTDHYNCVTDYVLFFDRLINSSGDVEILSRFEIINNCLGNDEVLAEIFSKLTNSVVILGHKFIYGEIFDKVEEHCSKRCNRWMANLRRNYLNSPWAVISIIATVVLLFLTLAETVFSGLSV